MKATVAERGQVTIPKPLRDKLGIRPGTALDFSAHNGTLVVHKLEIDPVSRVYGCLALAGDTDRHVRAVRGNAKP